MLGQNSYHIHNFQNYVILIQHPQQRLIKEVIEVLRDRSKSLGDMAKNSVMFYHEIEDFDSDLAKKFFHLESRSVLDDLLINLETLELWSAEHILEVIQSICQSRNIGFGKVGQPLRLAISGDGKAGSIV